MERKSKINQGNIMNQISYLKSQLTKTLPHLLSLSGYYYCWEKPLTDDMHQTYATRPNHATYRKRKEFSMFFST